MKLVEASTVHSLAARTLRGKLSIRMSSANMHVPTAVTNTDIAMSGQAANKCALQTSVGRQQPNKDHPVESTLKAVTLSKSSVA